MTILYDARGIYESEIDGPGQDAAFEIIKIIYGETFVRSTSFEANRTYERENRGRKRADSGTIDTTDEIKYSASSTEKTADYYNQRYAKLLEEYGAIKKEQMQRSNHKMLNEYFVQHF